MQNFTITTNDIDYQLKYGSVLSTVKVDGFWSSSQMSSHIDLEKDGQYKIRINTSSGGRDSKEVESDIESYTNFANALLALTEYTKNLVESENLVDRFLTIQKQLDEKYTKEREEKLLELQAKLEDTVSIDVKLAEKILKNVRDNGSATVIEVATGNMARIERNGGKYDIITSNFHRRTMTKANIVDFLIKAFVTK